MPIICSADLHSNIDRRKNSRPRLRDLKKVGIPEESVDQVIFLYNTCRYEDGTEWIVAKSPRGDTGTIQMYWDFSSGRFTKEKKSEPTYGIQLPSSSR